MRVYEPKCRFCGVTLVADDTLDIEETPSSVELKKCGHCPVCYASHTWVERFSYDGYVILTPTVRGCNYGAN